MSEAPIQGLMREVKEELSIDIQVIEYVTTLHEKKRIEHLFLCVTNNENPRLGGEELMRHHSDNYYEIKIVHIDKMTQIDLKANEFISTYLKRKYSK